MISNGLPRTGNTEEVQAESVSYAVCQYFGIETGENSFGYIATWSKGKELDELKASLEIINKTSCELINDIERNYKEICKERGIVLTAAPEPEQAPQQAVEESTLRKKLCSPAPSISRPLPPSCRRAGAGIGRVSMPDPAPDPDDLEKCGYLDGDLLPLSKERAYELMERDLTVYIVQQGENPEMAFDTANLDTHDGIFAVSREEWEKSPEFDKLVKDRMNHQEEREQAFLSHKGRLLCHLSGEAQPTSCGTSAMRAWNGLNPSDRRCSGTTMSWSTPLRCCPPI